MFDFFEGMLVGTRLFAQGEWWLRIKYLRDSFYLVVDPYAIMPAPILLVKQSNDDALYQEIMSRNFDKIKKELAK